MRPGNLESREQRSCSPFSNFPFPISEQTFCKLWICLLVITLSLHTTTGMAAKSPYDTIEQAASYIIEHQNDDGGWPLVPEEESDVEVTAIAMQALMLKGWGSGFKCHPSRGQLSDKTSEVRWQLERKCCSYHFCRYCTKASRSGRILGSPV